MSFRFTLAILVASSIANNANAAAPKKPPAVTAAPTFDLAQFPPYFSDAAGEAAKHKLRMGDFAGAATLFAADTHGPDADAARFMLLYSLYKSGQFGPATTVSTKLVDSTPLLADYVRFWGARSFLGMKQFDEALAWLAKIPKDSALYPESLMASADAAIKSNDFARARDALSQYVAQYPGSYRISEARVELGDAYEKLGKKSEAEAQYREVYIDAPTQSWGKAVVARMKEPTLSPDERMRRAMALFDQNRNSDSEAEFRLVLAQQPLPAALDCKARYNLAQSVFKARDRARAAGLFDDAATACEKAQDQDLWMKSIYQAGRCYGSRAEKDEVALRNALERFERASKQFPTHSYADDARLREAEIAEVGKDDAKMIELLSGMKDAFPTGDQRGEALWRLAFREWKLENYDAAEKWLTAELTDLPREEGWYEAGRTLYWLARVKGKQHDDKAALAFYTRAITEYPLSYYALAAFNRLAEKWPKQLAKLREELKPSAQDPKTWKFSARPLFNEPGFRRGVELSRLGLGAEAKREFLALGIKSPPKGTTVSPEDEELLWLTAVLFDQAEQYALSHEIPRRVVTSYAQKYPQGENHKRWAISYPHAYGEIIETNAYANNFLPALEFAIVREESAFDPIMESAANAVGLTQLTAPPAERFANGLPHDRSALHDPATNVAIGARELANCLKIFGGNPALAIPSYNAGESAVLRWLRDPERAHFQLDEFIESIPFDETRGYTKRVLSSYLAYMWLYPAKDGTRIPPLSFTLPPTKKK